MSSCCGAVDPGFVGAGALGGVVAVDGLEGGEHEPLGEEVGGGAAAEAAYVGAGEGEAAEAEVEELRGGHAEVVPGGEVVAGPGDGVALAAGVGGARHDVGADVGAEGELAFHGGAGVLHAVDVVDLGVEGGAGGEAFVLGTVDAVDDVDRAWSWRGR